MSLAEIAERGTTVPLHPYETFHEREAAAADSLVTCADGTQLSVIAGFDCGRMDGGCDRIVEGPVS